MKPIATIRKAHAELDLVKEIKKLHTLVIQTFRINAAKFISNREELIQQIQLIRSCSNSINILLDIPYPGNKHRISMLNGFQRTIHKGDTIILAFNQKTPPDYIPDYFSISGNIDESKLSYNQKIYYSDGLGEMILSQRIADGIYKVKALNHFLMRDRKSISFPIILKEDYAQFVTCICQKTQIDTLALSFVETPSDLEQAISLKRRFWFQLISKIESCFGIQNAAQIAQLSDGIMIGRGDLAIYGDYTKLLEYEDFLSQICHTYSCKYFIATDILTSMIDHCIPCRAKIIDLCYMMRLNPDFIILN